MKATANKEEFRNALYSVLGVVDKRGTMLCVNCGGIMLRTDEDIWSPLWEEQLRQQEEAP